MDKIVTYEEEVQVNIFLADTFMKRFMGYMFRNEPHYEAIMIKPCSSIHTFFMRFDIDVIFLDENMEVIKKVEALKPGKVIMPVKGAKIVIEGKTGIFKDVQMGSKINI